MGECSLHFGAGVGSVAFLNYSCYQAVFLFLGLILLLALLVVVELVAVKEGPLRPFCFSFRIISIPVFQAGGLGKRRE